MEHRISRIVQKGMMNSKANSLKVRVRMKMERMKKEILRQMKMKKTMMITRIINNLISKLKRKKTKMKISRIKRILNQIENSNKVTNRRMMIKKKSQKLSLKGRRKDRIKGKDMLQEGTKKRKSRRNSNQINKDVRNTFKCGGGFQVMRC